jgi:hypothetical protein
MMSEDSCFLEYEAVSSGKWLSLLEVSSLGLVHLPKLCAQNLSCLNEKGVHVKLEANVSYNLRPEHMHRAHKYGTQTGPLIFPAYNTDYPYD